MATCECGCGRDAKPGNAFVHGHNAKGWSRLVDRHEFIMSRIEVDQSSGCWNWTGTISPGGYGVASWNYKTRRAHRLSWESFCSAIPDGLFVCHKCDNPRCVNPDHLFLGTAQDNANDCVAKGRRPSVLAASCKRGHPFVPGSYYVTVRRGHTRRSCKACERIKYHAKRAGVPIQDMRKVGQTHAERRMGL